MGNRRQKLMSNFAHQVCHFSRVWPLWIAALLMVLKSATCEEIFTDPPSYPPEASTPSVVPQASTQNPLSSNSSRSAEPAIASAAAPAAAPAIAAAAVPAVAAATAATTAPVAANAAAAAIASAAAGAAASDVTGADAEAVAGSPAEARSGPTAGARSGPTAGARSGSAGARPGPPAGSRSGPSAGARSSPPAGSRSGPSAGAPVPPPAPAPSAAPTAAQTPNPISIDYGAYLESIAGPLGPDDLEYGLDYLNERDGSVLQEFDFDPERTAQFLINSAARHNTTPGSFLSDIQDLIFLQNRSRTENRGEQNMADVTSRVVPEPGLFMQSETWTRSVPLRDTWRKELHRLERKYRIGGNWSDPDAPTPNRILLMFPNFLNLGQKPFSGQTELCSGADVCLPSFFSYPEFAGLIPLSGNDSVRLGIFTVHLRALHLGKEDKNDALPFRTKCALVKRRMEKSLISDDRRWRFLQNNDVITANGDLTVSMEGSLEEIPKEFKERVVLTRTIPTKQRLNKLFSLSAQSKSSPKERSKPNVDSVIIPPVSPESKEVVDEYED